MTDFFFTKPPLEGATITGRFKEVYNLGSGPYEHPGLDWGPVTYGQEIRWWGNKSAPVRWRYKGYGDESFGSCCIVGPVDGLWVVFAHMTPESFEPDSVPLKMADPGDLLGWCGLTGTTTGLHCHTGMSREFVADGGVPGFAPLRVNGKITNPALLDPALYYKPDQPAPPLPPKPALSWEDVLTATYGTPERMQKLLAGGNSSLETRVDSLERNGDGQLRAALKALGAQF